MPIINEGELLTILDNSKKVLLLEPPFRRKYPPLGLARISTYLKQQNKQVEFRRYYEYTGEDLICIGTIFTTGAEKVIDEMGRAINLNPQATILIGGIFATLMPDYILNRFPNCLLFKGCSPKLDIIKPDYLIDWEVKEKWKDFSFIFTTRGCGNNCKYCAVKKIETETYQIGNWYDQINKDKKYIMINDNNLTMQPEKHRKDVFSKLAELGKGIIFDNGFDPKYIDRDFVNSISSVNIMQSGLRTAFDRISEDGIFQKAVETLLENDIKKSKIMAYILFNFDDTPDEAIYRAETCIKLGIRPYPQCFIPLNNTLPSNEYIGKYWTKTLRNSFRYFWLMAGYYTKYKFSDWLIEQDKYKVTDNDWKALNASR